MTMPIDLVLVRHGQSEGNAAKRRSEVGDNSAFTKAFLDRHTSSFRLTDLGCQQADLAGKLLAGDFFGDGRGFDRFMVSGYIRAIETAARLRIRNARWYEDFFLTERDWGDLDNKPEDERQREFGAELRRRQTEPFFWRPPNGESFAQFCLRIDRVLHTLHRECNEGRVIMVCHGEAMRAFQVRLERLSQSRFKQLTFSEKSEDRIHNCQINHYTRRNPQTGELSNYLDWVRWIRPAEEPIRASDWQPITRPTYSNNDLMLMAESVERMVIG